MFLVNGQRRHFPRPKALLASIWIIRSYAVHLYSAKSDKRAAHVSIFQISLYPVLKQFLAIIRREQLRTFDH